MWSKGSGPERLNVTKAESTRGCGAKTVRGTARCASSSQESCTSTDTAEYALVLGTANSRSASSRCSITAQRCRLGTVAMERMSSGTAML